MKLELYLKNRKYLIILFSSLFIFVVLFVYLFYFGKNTNMKKNTSSDFFKKNGQDLGRNLEKKVDNKEIAKSIVEWLKKMENQVALQCSNKECKSLGTDRQREIGSIWAFFNYYLYSKDKNYFDLFKEKLEKYAQLSRTQPFQSDFLQCYYLNDIYQKGIKEKLINESLKKDLDDICINNIYFREEDMVNSEKNINDFNGEFLINRIKSTTSIEIPTSNNGNFVSPLIEDNRHYLLFITSASDHVARYFILNGPTNLYIAKAYFDSAVEYFITNKEKVLSESPFLGLAAINIYKANLKNDYLNFAKFIFEYLDSKGAGNDDVLFKIGMTYLGREIYMATKEAKYLSSYKYYFDSLIKNNLDMVGYKGFRENKKIFHNGGNYIYIYDLRINYLMLDLILNN
jgi:hypothetical protein